ncbi:metal-dependent hydrolase family protein [Amycolatopsis japonica]|uniref:metal-dependent hydrolase family protein n=1 Tax=Amycolatopsis japonica TaxID=208439 RepID=UPI0037BA2427
MQQRIEASQLIPGRGAPIVDGVVIVEGDRIRYAGPRDEAPSTPGADVTRGHTVMPGMWDCHGHFMGLRSADLHDLMHEPIALRSARCVSDLRACLDSGFTSIREVGGLGIHLARAVAEGTIEGPTIYSAGTALSTTGGHGDVHGFPIPWINDFGHLGGELRLADGPAECARAAREQLRNNARLIKVFASGGVLSEVDHPHHQQFTDAELAAIVEVAGQAERVVAAHCHGKAGIMAALKAGVRTIEHGTYLDEEAAAAMRETGAILVPTRAIMHLLLTSDLVPPYAKRKLEEVAGRHLDAIALAREAGVTIALGTDLAMTGPDRPTQWGKGGIELSLMVKGGATPLEAIEMATAVAPDTLGPQAPRSGQLLAGYDADVLLLDADPVLDIGVLADPVHVTDVWKAGRQVKGGEPEQQQRP